MSIQMTMQVPNGLVGETINCRSGNSYQAGTNGIITGVSANDVNDLALAGAVVLDQAGSSTAAVAAQGILYQTSAGSSGILPAATNGDYVVAVYSIPSNYFDGLGLGQRSISVIAEGSVGSNTNNKRMKLYFNPTAAVVGATVSGGNLLADSLLTSSNGVGWYLEGLVTKTGAPGSNTQVSQQRGSTVGSTSNGTTLPLFPTGTESGTILVALTANASTTGAATTDIVTNLFRVVGSN